MFLRISEEQMDRNLLHTTTLRGFATSTTPGSQHDIFFDFLHAPTVKLNKQYKNQVGATTQQIVWHTQTVSQPRVLHFSPEPPILSSFATSCPHSQAFITILLCVRVLLLSRLPTTGGSSCFIGSRRVNCWGCTLRICGRYGTLATSRSTWISSATTSFAPSSSPISIWRSDIGWFEEEGCWRLT